MANREDHLRRAAWSADQVELPAHALRWLRADELDDLEWIAADRPLLPAVRALLTRL